MSQEKLQELCPVYAAGALYGEELRELQKHLKIGCPICQRQIREYGQMMVVYYQTMPGPDPPAGKILWNPGEKKALFYASNLPAPPNGKTYQLWVIAQNKPFDAGTFAVDSSGNGFLKIDSLSEDDKAQKFAVTLEPAGGVPQPTGETHLLSLFAPSPTLAPPG